MPSDWQIELGLTVKAFARRFGNRTLPETHRFTLLAIRKSPKEELEEYVSRVRGLVAKSYPGIIGSDLAEALTAEHLVRDLLMIH